MKYGKFNLDKAKLDKPTYIIVIYRFKGQRFMYSTGEKIHPNQWDKENGAPKDLNKRTKQARENQSINTQINRYMDFLGECLIESKELGIDITTKYLKEKFDKEFKINPGAKQVVEVFNIWLKVKGERQEVTESTLKKYRTHRNNLIRFEQYKQNSKKFKAVQHDKKEVELLQRKILKFTDLNKFYDEYVAFARSVRNQNNNSLSRSIKAYKGFLAWAKKNSYTKFSDFEDWKIQTFESEIITLTRNELEAMIKIDLSDKPKLDRVRDLFVLGCLTGGRFSDYRRISKADVYGDTLRIRPIKTGGKIVNIPLQDIAKHILEKYDYKLPSITNQKFNLYIKDIARLLDFNDEIKQVNFIGKNRYETVCLKSDLIASHTARKTFVTLALEGGMQPESVMKISGHSSYRSFKRYINITDNMVRNEAVKAFSFLNDNSNNLKVV